MKKTTALAKKSEFPVSTLQEEISNRLGYIARAISAKVVAPEYLGEALEFLKETSSAIEALERGTKARIEALLVEKGSVTTEKGSREVEAGGYKFSMRPHRTGVDPKSLEKLIRAKDLDPANYMDAKISFGVSDLGIQKLLSKERLTQDELESCKYEVKWVVNAPEKLED